MTDVELSKKLKTYRMSQDEYAKACSVLGRAPEGVEWALFSALWSEHCSYKSSKIHLKKLYGTSKRVVQSFGENAGVVDLGEGERVAFKMESHNHPSFIEPYQGAATGVGGILRDIFTMGARPIALANYLCFGEPNAPRMKSLVDGVVRGIGGYGNCVGVPTVTGQTEFHSSYNNNILVNAMAVGLFRKGEKIFLSKASGPGNWVVYVGAKTGRDGVHGASMASESFDESSASKRPTVQIGDPFFEKLLIESCLEVMQEDLVVAIQDMGAAGLTSSSFEMAAKGEVGFDLHLDQVPLRDASMQPEEILLSESQERMLLICEPKKFQRLQDVFTRWGLDAVKIGEVKQNPTVVLNWKGERLTEIDPRILVDEAPLYQRPFSAWQPQNRTSSRDDLKLDVTDGKQKLLSLLGAVQGTSREWIYRHYDQRVGAKTTRDCTESVAVVRLPDSGRGLGIVLGCRPHIMRFDAHVGGADSVAYPALELACKGFEPIAVTDCLNFGNPEREKIMSEFVASLDGMNLMCKGLEAPIISGNVSFYNETMGQNITSTPSTGLVGLRASIDRIPQNHFVKAESSLWLLRIPGLRMGGALQELEQMRNLALGKMKYEEVTQFVGSTRRVCAHAAVKATRVVGKFGLGFALARMAVGSAAAGQGLGCVVSDEQFYSVRLNPIADDLFTEHLYEVIIEVDQNLDLEFLQTFNDELNVIKDIELHRLGVVTEGQLKIGKFLDVTVGDLKSAYGGGWRSQFENLA